MTVKSFEQLEGNLSLSFGYVKKDIMAVNESIAELHTQIKHLNMNQAALMGKMDELSKILSKKPTKKGSTKKSLSFYDVKTKKKFTSSNYTLKTIKGKKFAIANSPEGNKCYRIIGGSKSKKKNKETTKKTKIVKTKKVEKKADATPKKVITETVLYE